MKMRKISVLVLIFILFSIVPICANGSEEAAVKDEYIKTVEALGFTWKEKGDIIDYGAYVTRGDMARLFAKLGNLPAYTGEGLTSDAGEINAVNSVVANSVMKVYDGGAFAPDSSVTLYDAVSGMMILLGYDKISQYKDFYMLAREKGLLSGISGDRTDFLKGTDAARLIYNAFDMQILDQKGFGEAVQYETRGETLLSMYHSIYKTEGQLTDNEYSGLRGETSVSSGKIKIAGEVMDKGDTNADFLLGYEVQAYYYLNKKTNEKKAIYVKPEREKEIFLYSGDIKNYSDRKMTYTKDGIKNKQYTANVSPKAVVIFNGKAVSSYTDSMLMPAVGDVTLIQTSGSSTYDVVIVYSYENYVVKSIDFDNCVLYDENTVGKKFTWENDAEVKIYDLLFNPLENESITNRSLICTAASLDKKLIHIMVPNKIISGTVSEIRRGAKEVFLIEGTEYEISKSYLEASKSIEAGVYGDFLMDIDGKVGGFRENKMFPWKFGYLVGAALSEGGFSDNIKIKVYNGIMEELTCRSDIIVDSQKISDTSSALSAITENQLILYKQNSSGEVTEIDQPYVNNPKPGESRASLYTMADIPSFIKYSPGIQSFNAQFLVSGATKVILIPSDPSEDSKYKLTTPSYFRATTYKNISAYSIGDECERADFLVYKQSNATSYSSDEAYYVFKEKTEAYDGNDDVDIIYYYDQSGNLKSAFTEEGYYDSEGTVTVSGRTLKNNSLHTGDVVFMSFNSDGKIYNITKIFDTERAFDSVSGEPAIIGGGTQYLSPKYFNVYKKMQTAVYVTDADPATVESTNGLSIYPIVCTVLIYDRELKKAEKGSINSINDYLYEPVNYTRMFMRLNSGAPQLIVIYK